MKRTELASVESSEYKTPDGGEGPAQFVKVELPAGEIRNVELYQQPGLASGATSGHTALLIPVSGGGYRIAIGAHNYGLSIEASAGHTKIYSTDATGATVKCLLHLKADGSLSIEADSSISTNSTGDTELEATGDVKLSPTGEVHLKGDSRTLVTYAELNTALQTLVSSINSAFASKLNGGGSPGGLTLDISSAEAEDVKVN